MGDKVFTFRVTYKIRGTDQTLYICATSTEEAKYKLLSYQDNDNDEAIDILDVEPIYNDLDAAIYNDFYGTPSDFADLISI